MKTIPMTQGLFAVVDDEDYEFLSQFSWSPMKRKDGGQIYAYGWTGPENGGYMTMHRLVLKDKPGFMADHKNGNGLDNRRENLRYATAAQNAWNSRRRTGKSGYRGVHKSGDRWAASIRHRGLVIQIGTYESSRLAALAYDRVARVLRGEFARLNFPGQEEPEEHREKHLHGVRRGQLKRKGCSSGYRGVCWSKWMNKWKASIAAEGTTKILGYFADETEAAHAYDRAAVRYRGQEARLNFPENNPSAAIDNG